MASSISAGWRPTRYFLAIDPYPRKPDAVFDVPVVPPDPEDHPFAALKALQVDAKPPSKKKPKRADPDVEGGSGRYYCG